MFGVIAAVGILMNATWAAPVGWIAAAFTLSSFGVGVWQLSIMLAEMGADAPGRGPFLVSAVAMSFIRLGLLAAYMFALVKYAAWVHLREEAAMQW